MKKLLLCLICLITAFAGTTIPAKAGYYYWYNGYRYYQPTYHYYYRYWWNGYQWVYRYYYYYN